MREEEKLYSLIGSWLRHENSLQKGKFVEKLRIIKFDVVI